MGDDVENFGKTQINWTGIASFGYEAYAKSAEWRNFEGKPMPQWGDLPEAVKKHWAAAAAEMCRVYGIAVTA